MKGQKEARYLVGTAQIHAKDESESNIVREYTIIEKLNQDGSVLL